METSLLNTNHGVHVEDQEKTCEQNELSQYFENVDYSHYFESVDSHIKIEIDDDKTHLRNGYSHLNNINNLNQNLDRECQNVNQGVKVKKEMFENENSWYENVDHTHCFQTTSIDSKSQDIDNLHKNTDTVLGNIKKEVMVKRENIDNIYIFENADSGFQDKDNIDDGMLVAILNTKGKIQNHEEQISEIEEGMAYPECEKYKTNFERSDLTITPDNIGSGVTVKKSDIDYSSKLTCSTTLSGHSKPKNIPNNFEMTDLKLESHMDINVTSDCANQIKINTKDSRIVREHPCADQPNLCADQPNPCADQPNPCAVQPNLCAEQPNPCAEQPNPCAEQPNPCAIQPNLCADQPNLCVIQPNPCAEQPNPCADQPNLCADQPNLCADQPNLCNMCRKCPKEFDTFSKLGEHVTSHSINTAWPHRGGKVFKGKTRPRKHIASISKDIVHAIVPHKCDMCNKEYKTVHLMSHSRPTEMLHKCNVCGKVYKSSCKLTRHMTSHQLHKCTVCENVFNSSYKLRQHMTSHRSLACATLSKI